MNGIRLPLFAAVWVAVSPALGQQIAHDYPSKSGTNSIVQVSEFDSPQQNNITVANPIVIGEKSGEKSNVSFSSAETTPVSPARPVAPVFQSDPGVPAKLAQAPPPLARPVAQETVTKSHRIRLAPHVFEKNLVEKLGSRFVPVRNVEEASGLSRYRLPARDGTHLELVINHQQGAVFVTGTPRMVDSSLQIMRLLDTEETPTLVTRFVPVQQSAMAPARRFAGMVNQETQRVAQATVPGAVAANGAPRPELEGEEPTAASIVGPVNINMFDDWGQMSIIGSPRDVETIRGILQQLETLSQENEPIIELVPMRHADSLRISQLVQQLYTQIYVARRGAVTMVPLVKPNTILIIGRQESINTAKELIAKLDTPVDPNAAFQIFPLKYAAASDLMNQINQSFQSRPGYGSGLSPQIFVVADQRTNALIALANPRDLMEIAAMIRQIDIPGSEVTCLVRPFPLKNALAQELASILQNAFSATTNQRQAMLSADGVDADGNLLRSSLLYNVTIVADTRGNAVIVTAPPETMPIIEDIIDQLDRLPSVQSKIRVFTLVNANAYDLTTLLNNMFSATGTGTGTQTSQIATVRPGTEEGESTLVSIRFQTDIRTNSIVAIGSEGDLAVAEALLLRLDAENLNNRRTFLMKLVNVPAEEIAPVLSNYFNTERQIDIQNSTQILPSSPLEQYQKEVNVIAEPISNSLVVTTTPRYYDQLVKIIKELDERPRMVAVDILIAEVAINRSKDRGVEFGLQDSILFDRSIGTAGFPGLLAGNPAVGSLNSGTVGAQGITSLVPATAAGTGGFSFSASSESVSIFIRALETYNKTQILSRPRLVTLHNQRAQIRVGQNIPYAGDISQNNNTTLVSTAWLDNIGTSMDITPRIMPDDMIAMAIYVERASVGEWRNIGTNTAPVVNTTNASTTLNAMDGQTVIFAGLITEEKISTNISIPGLNKIPVIKHMFEYDLQSCNRSELVIVMTPRIIRTRADFEMMNQEESERMHWCINDVVRLMGPSYGGMRLRSDDWYPTEVRHTHVAPILLNDSQLPPENKIPMPVFPGKE